MKPQRDVRRRGAAAAVRSQADPASGASARPKREFGDPVPPIPRDEAGDLRRKTVRTNPRFWDRIAERYAKTPVKDEVSYQKKLEVTRGYFRPEMEAVEIGCGTGSTAIAHAPHVKHILATDISPRMIEIARSKAEAARTENVTFAVATAEDVQVDHESVGMVMAHSLLHLVADREAVIARVHRMLKPGGLFVSSTACMGDSHQWFKLVGPVGRWLGVFPLVRIFTAAELADSLNRGGFDIEYQWQPRKGTAVFIVARKRMAE
jgi:SAM-dependent methyltransferase